MSFPRPTLDCADQNASIRIITPLLEVLFAVPTAEDELSPVPSAPVTSTPKKSRRLDLSAELDSHFPETSLIADISIKTESFDESVLVVPCGLGADEDATYWYLDDSEHEKAFCEMDRTLPMRFLEATVHYLDEDAVMDDATESFAIVVTDLSPRETNEASTSAEEASTSASTNDETLPYTLGQADPADPIVTLVPLFPFVTFTLQEQEEREIMFATPEIIAVGTTIPCDDDTPMIPTRKRLRREMKHFPNKQVKQEVE